MMRKTKILFTVALALGAAGLARADDAPVAPPPPHCLKKCRVAKAAERMAPRPLRHNDKGHVRAEDYFGPANPAPNDPPPR